MNKFFARWMLAVTVGVASLATIGRAQQAPEPQQQQFATAEQLTELKVQAYQAFKGGHFDRTSELLSRAASLSSDPSLAQMSQWIAQFQNQRQGFVEERRKQFDKSIAETKKLLDAGNQQYALDRAKDAYSWRMTRTRSARSRGSTRWSGGPSRWRTTPSSSSSG
jgi:uncharacterized membrane-anchored protein YhcB (DUF1043 family)